MRAVFSSVTRLFRRPSFLTAARSHPTTTSSSSSSPTSSPTSSPKRPRKGRSKSRHELISDAHIAYMQEASMFSSSPSSYSSLSSLSLPLSSSWTESSNGRCNEEQEREGEEAEVSSPAFESLCHGLRRAEESMSRYLFEPNHFYQLNGPSPYRHPHSSDEDRHTWF
jgi:hypothetical protein